MRAKPFILASIGKASGNYINKLKSLQEKYPDNLKKISLLTG